MGDDAELLSLLNGYTELLEGMRRLATLADVLLQRAMTATPLTSEEAAHARHEIEVARQGVNRLDVMITLRRQQLRPM